MKRTLLASLIVASVAAASQMAPAASAQSPILLNTYGQGVHAFYNHQSAEAAAFFTQAISNGLEDPRAYYFRGMVQSELGNTSAAEEDWTAGAELEAAGKIVGAIGPALTRFQGPARLRLEQIRQTEKLEYLAQATARSQARYGELDAAAPDVLRGGRVAPSADIPPAAAPPAAAAPQQPAVRPPAPPVAEVEGANDLFGGPARGDAAVETSDALENAMQDPFADDPVPTPTPEGDAPADVPFGSDGAPAGDPFGGGTADPFGGSDAADNDPFGGSSDDPFGN